MMRIGKWAASYSDIPQVGRAPVRQDTFLFNSIFLKISVAKFFNFEIIFQFPSLPLSTPPVSIANPSMISRKLFM